MVVKDIEKEIIKRFKKLNPYKIIIFGSYADNSFTKDSDIDIYVVTNDEYLPKDWNEKINIYLKYSKEIRDLHERLPIDLIVHTKKMFEKMSELKSSFYKNIKNGKVIWEKR